LYRDAALPTDLVLFVATRRYSGGGGYQGDGDVSDDVCVIVRWYPGLRVVAAGVLSVGCHGNV